MNKQNIFKKINPFELGLIAVNTLVYLVWVFFFHDVLSLISWASYLFYMVALFLTSIGKWQSHVFNIVSYAFYIYICIYYFYLGELIITFATMIISFVLIFVWRDSQETNQLGKKQLKTNQVSVWELVVSNAIGAGLLVGFYYVFLLTNSNEVFINAVMMTLSVLYYYFAFRINKVSFVYGFLSIITYAILWAKTFVAGDYFASIYIIGSVFSFVWTVYSYYHWNEAERLTVSPNKTADGKLKQ